MDYEDDYEDYDDFEGEDDCAPLDDTQSDEPITDESDEFTATDAFFIGGAMGWAYEEGIDEGRRRSHKRKRRRDVDEDPI